MPAVVYGLKDNVSMVIRRVISQMSVPNQMRGRVQAVTAIFVGSSNEIGGFESGAVAQLFPPVISVVINGWYQSRVTFCIQNLRRLKAEQALFEFRSEIQ